MATRVVDAVACRGAEANVQTSVNTTAASWRPADPRSVGSRASRVPCPSVDRCKQQPPPTWLEIYKHSARKPLSSLHFDSRNTLLCAIHTPAPRFAMQQASADDSFAHLSRLSQKAGVQATLILSRQTGAIVRSSGLVSSDESANPESTLPASNGQTDDRNESAMPSAEHVAEVVWRFAKAAGDMLQELSNSPDDDVRLLRLRSKNKEYVIFPGIVSLCKTT